MITLSQKPNKFYAHLFDGDIEKAGQFCASQKIPYQVQNGKFFTPMCGWTTIFFDVDYDSTWKEVEIGEYIVIQNYPPSNSTTQAGILSPEIVEYGYEEI